MKIKRQEITKTMNDFIFLGAEKAHEKAKKLLYLRYSLTEYWFKKYLQYYFQKYKNYKINIEKKWDKNQKINLKGIKYKNFRKQILLIWCKNYKVRDIGENNIIHFYEYVKNKISKNNNFFEIIFISTTDFSQKAKDFWKTKWIKMLNFHDIYQFLSIYPLETFKKDIFHEEGTKELKKSFFNFLIQESFDFLEEFKNNELYDIIEKIRIKIATKINSPPKKQKSSNLEIFKKRLQKKKNENLMKNKIRQKTKTRSIFSFFF